MDSDEKVRYEPSPDFEEVKSDPLIDISLSDSTELWLIEYPKIQGFLKDLHEQEVTLKLHRDGCLGSFVDKSGKSYDVVQAPAPDPDVALFLSSDSGTKIGGKISRRVSLVHYPEPSELEQKDMMKLKAQKAVDFFTTPSNMDGTRNVQAMSSYKSSIHKSNRTKSSGSKLASRLASKTPKKGYVEEPMKDQSAGDSGKRSGVTNEDSPHINLKKKVKTEG